jgi:threonine dehydrogenase-like Zn-dependent dehydrogenase
MKAACYNGKQDVAVEDRPEPQIVNPRDAIVRVTLAAICGSDLHLYNGWNPTMEKGDILGHEFMGEVVDVGPAVQNVKAGDRVVVPFAISCGRCWFCKEGLYSLCENSNPNAWLQEKAVQQTTAGLFGYSHAFGGYAGGQAQYVRVPFADVGGFKVPDGLTDEQALFTGDILSTAYMAAENCGIKPGDTVAVFGCGPVGLLSMVCAYHLGATKVIAIDRFEARLRMAEQKAGALPLNYEDVEDLGEALKNLTGGRGPDHCIEAVGMDAHGPGLGGLYDKAKQKVRLETDRPNALREAIMACRPGGTVSIPGVYSGFVDKMPMGIAFNKGLTFKMGQTHVHKYIPKLLPLIESGAIDPTFIISDRIGIEDVPDAYRRFNDKEEPVVKVVIRPNAGA